MSVLYSTAVDKSPVVELEGACRSRSWRVGRRGGPRWRPTTRPTCDVCHAPLRGVDRARPITVRGIFGDYRLERAY